MRTQCALRLMVKACVGMAVEHFETAHANAIKPAICRGGAMPRKSRTHVLEWVADLLASMAFPKFAAALGAITGVINSYPPCRKSRLVMT